MKKILFLLLMLCSITAWAEDDGFVNVATTKQLWDAIKADAHAKVRLTADFALSDIDKDYELYCETFYGTIDGNGHTIKGDPKADVRARTYMFHYSEGATFKNLTFKGIRVNSQSDSNQAIITSQAKNGCVFENITFDNIHSFSNYNNVGAAAGYAYDCTFTNIKVMNSDFTVDDNYVGTVVGDADKCTFTNIEVIHCESTAYDDCAGGVVGHSRNCRFENVEVKNSFFTVDGKKVGGIAAASVDSRYSNCVIDDQTCICADGDGYDAYAGGIVGYSQRNNYYDCINSALVAGDNDCVGGIVGYFDGEPVGLKIGDRWVDYVICRCLNTGMVVSVRKSKVVNELYEKYKKEQMKCVHKYYKGKKYVVRITDLGSTGDEAFGGIVGWVRYIKLTDCVNFGSMNETDSTGGIIGMIFSRQITVVNCLSDFESPSDDVYGFFADMDYEFWGTDNMDYVAIDNYAPNLNATNYRLCPKDMLERFYYPMYTISAYGGNDKETKVTRAQLAPGPLVYTLGWEQNLLSDDTPIPSGNRGLYHTRKVSNQYGTVCLPYFMKPNDKISYYCLDENLLKDDLVTLKFKYIEEVRPGLPVLFRIKDFNDTPQDMLPLEVCFNCADASLGFENTPFNYDGGYNEWSMVGTFEEKVFTETTNIPSNEIYYLSNGVIRNAKKVTIDPYRAFLYRPDLEKLGFLAKSIQIEIEDEDGETTALESVGCDLVPVQNNGKTYSIMGTEVNNNYRGIVIRNGKKMIQNR